MKINLRSGFKRIKGFVNIDNDSLVEPDYIVNITYGRDVGYKIEQEVFDEATHSVSATKIRKTMGLE